MSARRVLTWGLLAAAMCVTDVRRVTGQTTADLFDSQVLQDIRLFINSRDLQELKDRYLEDIYVPADLHWRGLRVRNVGVRVRGFTSRNPIKPGLRVDFNRYVTGQRFLGLDALALDSVTQDPALIREHVGQGFFARMGQAAPRVSHARLYINNSYQGVYAIIEPIDGDFVLRTLGEADGYLFEYRPTTPYFGEDLGDDLQAYKRRFEAQTHRTEADTILYLPIRELFRVANEADEGFWRQRIAQVIDLRQFVTHVAIEAFLVEDDGVNGASGMANFFLYRSAGQTVHRLLPWDKDRTLQEIERSIFARADSNVLFRRALTYPDLRALYLDVLDQCARRALEDGWLLDTITQASSLIADAAHEDRWKFVTNEEYDAATEFLKEFARQRPAFVLQEVSRAR